MIAALVLICMTGCAWWIARALVAGLAEGRTADERGHAGEIDNGAMEQSLLRHGSQLYDLHSKVDVMQGQIEQLQCRVADLERIVGELVIASLDGEQLKAMMAGLTVDEYNRLVARQCRRVEFMEAEHATR